MPRAQHLKGKLKYFSRPYVRRWKWMWQQYGKMVDPALLMPFPLKGKDIKIIDPMHPHPPPPDSWKPPTRHPGYSRFFPKPKPEEAPNWHKDPAFVFNRDVRFHAGIQQACMLTKTQPSFVLPDKITSLIGKVSIPNQDELVKASIKRGIVWDATKQPLPKPTALDKPKMTFNREYGAPRDRQMYVILSSMIQLCNSLGSQFPSLLDRRMARHLPLYTYFFRGDERIHIHKTTELATFTRTQLLPFAKETEVDASVAYQLPNLYPVFPTVDLEQENIYEDKHTSGFKQGNTMPHHHTFYLFHVDNMTAEQRQANALMFCFGHCLAQAKYLYGEQVQKLEKPISIQCISLADERFYFTAFQLNTLQLSSDTGVKNQVWFDQEQLLYFNAPSNEHAPYASEKNRQRYVTERLEYNPDVFRRLLAFHLNGAGHGAPAGQ